MTQYGDYIIHPRRRTEPRLKALMGKHIDAMLIHLDHKGCRPKVKWFLNQPNYLFWEDGQAWESKKARNYVSGWKLDI